MKTVNFTGTVSQATMRAQDVLPACLAVLSEFYPDRFNAIVYEIAYGDDERFTTLQASCVYSDILADDDHSFWESDDCAWLLNETVWDAMQEIAPAGYYFGSHPGDGADYGYWRVDPSDTGCCHEWVRHNHSVDGWVNWCPLCHTIAEYIGHKVPCVECGCEPVGDTRFCPFCDGKGW